MAAGPGRLGGAHLVQPGPGDAAPGKGLDDGLRQPGRPVGVMRRPGRDHVHMAQPLGPPDGEPVEHRLGRLMRISRHWPHRTRGSDTLVPVEFVVDERLEGDDRIVSAQGELDLHTAPRLAEALAPQVDAGGYVIADLTAVTFMDSSGVAVFVNALARAREAGAELAIAGPQPRVRRVLEITGLDGMLPVHDSLAAARRS